MPDAGQSVIEKGLDFSGSAPFTCKYMKIIFVCHGNICRSPMAEYIMKDLVRKAGKEEEFDISSAAVSREEEGNPIYPPAARMLRSMNVPYGTHSAHRITAEEAGQADLIIIMDGSNERIISRIINPADFSKVHYMMEYAGSGCRDVADPWYTGNFDRTYADLLAGCRGLLASLTSL